MQTETEKPQTGDTEGLDAIQQNLDRLRAALGSSQSASKPAPRQPLPDTERTQCGEVGANTLSQLENLETGGEHTLDRMKVMLKKEALAVRQQAEALEVQRKHAADIINQRNQVVELQRLLGDAEQRMIRRWGIQQAFGWTIRALVCLTILMGLSAFVGQQLSRQVFLATASVQHFGAAIEQPEEWLKAQEKLLRDPATLQASIAHLQRAGFAGSTSTKELTLLFDGGLAVAHPGSGVLHLELRGENKESLIPILNALANAYKQAVDRQNNESASGAQRVHINQDARLADFPVFDNRSTVIATLFSASVGVTLLLIGLFSFLIIRSGKGEVAAIRNEGVADDNAWKSYHDALEGDKKTDTQPLF